MTSEIKRSGAPITTRVGDTKLNVSDPSSLNAMWQVLGWAIFAAAGIMMGALIIQMLDHTMTEATKDVLPLSTALVGFAGGAITALFGRNVAEAKKGES